MEEPITASVHTQENGIKHSLALAMKQRAEAAAELQAAAAAAESYAAAALAAREAGEVLPAGMDPLSAVLLSRALQKADEPSSASVSEADEGEKHDMAEAAPAEAAAPASEPVAASAALTPAEPADVEPPQPVQEQQALVLALPTAAVQANEAHATSSLPQAAGEAVEPASVTEAYLTTQDRDSSPEDLPIDTPHEGPIAAQDSQLLQSQATPAVAAAPAPGTEVSAAAGQPGSQPEQAASSQPYGSYDYGAYAYGYYGAADPYAAYAAAAYGSYNQYSAYAGSGDQAAAWAAWAAANPAEAAAAGAQQWSAEQWAAWQGAQQQQPAAAEEPEAPPGMDAEEAPKKDPPKVQVVPLPPPAAQPPPAPQQPPPKPPSPPRVAVRIPAAVQARKDAAAAAISTKQPAAAQELQPSQQGTEAGAQEGAAHANGLPAAAVAEEEAEESPPRLRSISPARRSPSPAVRSPTRSPQVRAYVCPPYLKSKVHISPAGQLGESTMLTRVCDCMCRRGGMRRAGAWCRRRAPGRRSGASGAGSAARSALRSGHGAARARRVPAAGARALLLFFTCAASQVWLEGRSLHAFLLTRQPCCCAGCTRHRRCASGGAPHQWWSQNWAPSRSHSSRPRLSPPRRARSCRRRARLLLGYCRRQPPAQRAA
jgi:hypothetical protein